MQWLQPTSNNIAKIKIRNKFVKNSPSSWQIIRNPLSWLDLGLVKAWVPHIGLIYMYFGGSFVWMCWCYCPWVLWIITKGICMGSWHFVHLPLPKYNCNLCWYHASPDWLPSSHPPFPRACCRPWFHGRASHKLTWSSPISMPFGAYDHTPHGLERIFERKLKKTIIGTST